MCLKLSNCIQMGVCFILLKHCRFSGHTPGMDVMNANAPLSEQDDLWFIFVPFWTMSWLFLLSYTSCQFCNQTCHFWFVPIIIAFSVQSHSCCALIWPRCLHRASKKQEDQWWHRSLVEYIYSSVWFFLPISPAFPSSDGQCQDCVEVEFHQLSAACILSGHRS